MEKPLEEFLALIKPIISPIIPYLEKFLREVLGMVYPNYQNAFNYSSLLDGFIISLLILLFCIILKVCFSVFKRSRVPYVIGFLILIIVFSIPVYSLSQNIAINEASYSHAKKYLNNKQYKEAIELLDGLGTYREADKEAKSIREMCSEEAHQLMQSEKLDEALYLFLAIGDFEDSKAMVSKLQREIDLRDKYLTATEKFSNHEYLDALPLFEELDNYKDSKEMASAINNILWEQNQYQQAIEKMNSFDYDSALALFQALDDEYLDVASRKEEATLLADNYVGSWEQIREKLIDNAKAREKTIVIAYPSDIVLSEHRSDLSEALYSVGVSRYNWSFKNKYVEITDIEYYEDFEICATALEVLTYLEECATANKTDFRLYLSYDLANTLFENEHIELESLLSQSRLKYPSNYSYSENTCRIIFSNASYYGLSSQSSGSAKNIAEFVHLFSEHTERCETEFEIMITDELKEEIFSDSFVSAEYSLFSEIQENCGIISLSSYTSGHYLGIRNVEYYPGKIILNAYRNGTIDDLQPRERETLNSALQIVSKLSGTELAREKQIHDLLCDRVVYYTDDIPHDDNDCAIGALLDGKADCDGYSDAFYLCGNLAGLKVHYQHGDSLLPTISTKENDGNQVEQDGTHMWNLININGKWTMIDITWDDNETGHSYVYYNLGESQASVTHVWDKRAIFVDLLSVSDNTLRNEELVQTHSDNWQDVYALLQSCALEKMDRICFSFPRDLNLRNNRERLSSEIRSVGIKDFFWDISIESAEVYQIEYYDNFAICSSEKEVIEYINKCATKSISEFWIYFSPSISSQMFANDMYNMKLMFAKTKLQNPFRYSYNEECRRVQFSNVSYYKTDNTLSVYSVKSLNDVSSALLSHPNQKTNRFLFEYRDIDLEENHEELSRALYSAGVESFSWSFNSGFVLISNIVYYDDYKICSSREEVALYIKECKAKHTSSIRIYCANDELYNLLHGGQSKKFFDLLSESGCKNNTISYNDTTKLLLVENPVW